VEGAAIERRSLEESHLKATVLLARAEERAARIVEEAREELTALAVRMAEKILGEELRLRPDAVCAIAQQCLSTSPAARNLRLRVSPEDLPLLQAALPRLGRAGARLELQADESISRGGCLLQSELGEVDGRLEVQLARLAEALSPEGQGERS
jgi:flagellar biosynthesis/type III secretory pathway protein FliH